MRSVNKQPIKIGFVLYDKSLLTAVTLASEMFMSANALRPRAEQRQKPVEIEVIASAEHSVETAGTLRLTPSMDFSHQTYFDLLFLPPMWGNPMPSITRSHEIGAWIRSQVEQHSTIVATGTGVCWLAYNGLLEGEIATTHWFFAKRFKTLFPQVQLREDMPITKANNIYCAKSINAQTDLVVFFIAKMFGQSIAQIIERHFTQDVSDRQHEPYFQLGGEVQPDEIVAIAQEYLANHLTKQVSTEFLASYCGVSSKTLLRHFKIQVGESPHQYHSRLKLNQAKSLLLDKSLTISDVAELVGFSDSHYFATKFLQAFGLRPKAYREIAKTKLYRV